MDHFSCEIVAAKQKFLRQHVLPNEASDFTAFRNLVSKPRERLRKTVRLKFLFLVSRFSRIDQTN